VIVFHAATRARDGRTLTAGGRVLGVTGLGTSYRAARDRAYSGVAKIRFEGAHCRGDIAARALAAND
jgi:phosphoribosylamine--glycine ligase